MPLKTPRSACSNVKSPSIGVWPGSSRCHGPNDPSVTMSPGGTALVSVDSNGMAVSIPTLRTRRRCIAHVRWSRFRSRGMITSLASSATSWSTTTCGPLNRWPPLVAVAAGASASAPSSGGMLYLEAFEAHVLDVPAPCADEARLHRERLDGDERRDIGPPAVADGQVGANRMQHRKGMQCQAAQLDLGVEPVTECFRDALAQDLRREGDPGDDGDREDREHGADRGTDEPAPFLR